MARRLTLLACLAALAVACTGSDLDAPSTFAPSEAATACSSPVESLPPTPPPGTLVRAITFHVTNDSGQPRWVQTTADDGCSTFDLLRGGAPFSVVPPAACGCDCKAPEPRTSYTRLAPGESLDLPWNGLVYQLVSRCVTGAAFGCAEGMTREVLTATASAALATRYDGVLHVESVEPVAVAGQCAYGTGVARFDFQLVGADAAPEAIAVSLK